GVSFTVTAAPSITSLVPTSGIVGAAVTINGSGFGPTQGNGKVTFNGTTATINSWSATQITTSVPAGATTGSVIVTAAGGVASKGVTFTVIPPPSITSISPTSGVTGTAVTISGSNFGSTQGSSAVTFNGTAGTVTSWSSTKVIATVPTAATTGNVVVTVNTQASNGVNFKVLPHITSDSPTTQPIGKNVTINGSGFGTSQGSSTVTIGGVAASAGTWTTTQIIATVPSGAAVGSDPIVVTVGGSASNSVAFTAVAALAVTASAAPTPNANGWNNTNVTISYTCSGGVTPVQCPATKTVSTEGLNQTITATATDANGNTTSVSTSVSIDKTAPTITATVTPAANAKGVVTAPATVTFTCSDSLSGIASCPSPVQVTTAGLNKSFSGSATDKAGNTANATLTVSVQTAPLAITATAAPQPNANNWNNSNVTISYACSGGVAPLQCPGSQTVSAEGANQSVSASVTDAAGQTASASSTLNIDKTPPTITASVSPVPDAQGVVVAPATITFACSDTLSGVASCPSPIQASTLGLNESFSGTATDKAGNSASATITISLEASPLTITATATPQANAAGWNNTPVTISYTCSGGVAPLQCPGSQTVSTEGANQISATVTDAAGQTASTSLTVKVDLTPPTATPVITPSPNAAGWNNTAVTVSFTCSDSVSGVASCPASIQLSTEGSNQQACGTVVDMAGNTANFCATVSIDETPPTISASVSPTPNSNGIIFGPSATVTFTCSDALSGVASCPSTQTITTQGFQTISGTAFDVAGNSASGSVQFNLQNFPPLQIIAVVTPAPNAAGWNNSPVTVSFQCSGGAPPVSCPGSQTVSSDGANQIITGTATDSVGSSATANATINLDQTPPLVS
ncbi:MAG TPA: IPT/TIG domain-containing protein, partial [Candidatus Sulfotelmatobacter sp.]|nr:IPT/TIG domain-containing protein [Candidatus Sulfotelmatobacter sp.]